MPIYVYKCENGHRHEVFFKMAEKPDTVQCDKCKAVAKQIPAIGGIESDSPTWLDDTVREALQDSDMIRQRKIKPIETRGELNAFLKHTGMVCVG